jgi:hypothetical protein
MPTKTEAVEVFRQFAWNLAGSLVVPRVKRTRPSRPGPGRR